MENAEQIKGYLAELIRQIDAEAITDLDFDRLRRTITELSSLLDANKRTEQELSLLRRDYIRRIAGMEKAIAVAARRRGSIKQALEKIEGLDMLSAAQLVERYRKTQARFQDTFPASFGLLSGRGRHVTETEFKYGK